MNSQWENFLKNKGEWHGSFRKFSPTGIEISKVASILLLESLNNDCNARINLRRFYPRSDLSKEPLMKTLVQEFQHPLPADLFFFDNGSFARGMIQIYANSTPIIEFNLLDENRRSRQVQKYNWNGNLEYITLICESDYPHSPKGEKLEIDALLGTWIGNAIAIDRKEKIDRYQISTQLDLLGDLLIRVININGEKNTQTGKIKGSVVDFDTEKILLLEDGAWANFPSPIKLGRSFVFEVGWLFANNSSQRVKRCYNEKGEWNSTILITESRV